MEQSVFLGKTDIHTISLLPNDIAYICENSLLVLMEIMKMMTAVHTVVIVQCSS